VTAYNRGRERAQKFESEGGKTAATPAQAASGAEVVISMLADDDASRSAWLGDGGILSGTKPAPAPGAILIESSTLTPRWVKELAGAAGSKGYRFLDAPVTGSRTQAEGGQLLFLIGGDPQAAAEAQPVLDPMCRAVLHMGPVGSGTLIKLINNFVCGVQAASLAEALAVTERLGVDVDKAMKVLGDGAPGSPLVKTLGGRMTARNYEVHFDLRLMAKDLRYALEMGAEAKLPLRTVQAALELFREAADSKKDEKRDMSAIVELLRAR
jgi:3-hydroxyisobutyrate dehydrogenase